MTERTDHDLGELLKATFTAAEPLADGLTTSAAARRRPRWIPVLAAAASMVLAIGIAWAVAGRHHPATSPVLTPAPTVSAGPLLTYADNRRAAERESARVLDLAPRPSHARRLHGKPAGWPCCGMSLGPSDGTLTRTSWYSAPLDADQVETFLVTHVPAGMRLDDHEPGQPHSGVGGGSDGVRDLSYSTIATDPAFAGTSLLVQWRDLGPFTALRFDTFLAAREVRNPETYVTGSVSSAEVHRTTDRVKGFTTPADADVVITDRTTIDQLVRAVNALEASTRPVPMTSCPFRPRTAYTLSLSTRSGTQVFQVPGYCLAQVAVTVNGTGTGPTLDPGRLVEILDRTITRS